MAALSEPKPPERILIGVAWPYANGPLHMGHIAGCYLAADIFARYHRMKGNAVLMVSGSDAHGTPITIRADQEGVAPDVILERYHSQFLDTWQRLGITFDRFTTTHTANHQRVVQDFFLRLRDAGYIYPDTMLLAYCARCVRFLPDRYVEGTCPHCQNAGARGDQCDACGRTLDPIDLLNPYCNICNATPDFRESEHFFLRLSAFQEPLLEWIESKTHWRPNVANQTASFLRGGLKDRAITRDLAWGVPVPLDGYADKRIYVWFEAVIGYLSAAIEWAQSPGADDDNDAANSNAWQAYWQNPAARSYYFIGKDNIPFHSIIWPAMLMGYGGLNLPYDVPANEFLSLESRKFSTSQNWALWVPDYLDHYDPDPLRYMLSINMPESGDTDFSWAEFVRRNNDELVATWGNLVNRVLRFTYRNFDGQIPAAANPPGVAEAELLDAARHAMASVDDSLYHTRFRAGISAAFAFAQQVNRYLDARAPWLAVKTDRADAAAALTAAMQAINCLKVMLQPYLPFTSQKVHEFLGFDGDAMAEPWDCAALTAAIQPGAPLRNPAALYAKLDADASAPASD